MITLQYVRECDGGFECRLWDLCNDITIARSTLAELHRVALYLMMNAEFDPPKRNSKQYKELMKRLEQSFANPKALLPKSNVPDQPPTLESCGPKSDHAVI